MVHSACWLSVMKHFDLMTLTVILPSLDRKLWIWIGRDIDCKLNLLATDRIGGRAHDESIVHAIISLRSATFSFAILRVICDSPWPGEACGLPGVQSDALGHT